MFGEEWEETPLRRRDGSIVETTYRLESDEFVAVRECGGQRVELRTEVSHWYNIIVEEPASRSTMADGFSCRLSYAQGEETRLFLSEDGQTLTTGSGATEIVPWGEVNGILGAWSFIQPEATVEWFVYPQDIFAVARCVNGIRATVTVPVFIEHRFRVEDTVSATQGDCELEFLAGVYRYYPEVAGELLLEREGGSLLTLTQVVQ